MKENQEQLVIKQQTRITELEKIVRKKEREISRLQTSMEQEKIYANTKINQIVGYSIAQREQDRYFHLLLSNSPNIIICFDHTGHIVFFSDILLKLTGKTNDSTSGKQISEVLGGFCKKEIITVLTDNLRMVLAENKPCSVSAEIGTEAGDGRRKYIITIIPMTSSETGNEGAMAIFYDITDIEHSREEAERANAAKTEFLSNMSHEIRTPLNAITGMTAIAKGSTNIGYKNDCLEKIDTASKHLLDIINDIFDMSKIEANKLKLSSERFSFEKTIQAVVNDINSKINEKHQNFSMSLDKTIPEALKGDAQRLAQIITNLLSNAAKFTPEGGTVSLTAHLARTENDIFTIQVEISDTGIGISAEQQSRLFSPFQQLDSGTSRRFGGTGLGLAISKRLVEMMGGNIWVKSELGKGALFAFTFRAKCGTDKDTITL